jgi:hypothetical protein
MVYQDPYESFGRDTDDELVHLEQRPFSVRAHGSTAVSTPLHEQCGRAAAAPLRIAPT